MKTLAKWSVDDYHRMIEVGILSDRSVELLKGEIVEMSPETPIHYVTAKRDAKYLEQLLLGKAEVRFNGPITLSDSEPEPDIAIVKLPESLYFQRHPLPSEIFWVIEVADTSLQRDIEIKGAIYAQAGIEEYWVLDLLNQQIIVLRNLQNNCYSETFHFSEGSISPLSFPYISISVRSLFLE